MESTGNQVSIFNNSTSNSHDQPRDSASLVKHKWTEVLSSEFESEYYKNLRDFVKAERAKGKEIYPPDQEIFKALSLTPLESVKVVILGQDPYHGPNQAHGLCFSVKPGVRPPPSLLNIFKEIGDDLGIAPPPHGYLEKWARQGVLLLNAVLSVQAGLAGSHQNMGWEKFTDRVIEIINSERTGVVFLLWGSHAQKKGAIIDPIRHHILKAPHPSPLSAHRGFFGCKHFSTTNEILVKQGKTPIDWNLNKPSANHF